MKWGGVPVRGVIGSPRDDSEPAARRRPELAPVPLRQIITWRSADRLRRGGL